MDQFEQKLYGMGVNKGMFAHNGSKYIHPIIYQLHQMYLAKDPNLTAYYVNSLIGELK